MSARCEHLGKWEWETRIWCTEFRRICILLRYAKWKKHCLFCRRMGNDMSRPQKQRLFHGAPTLHVPISPQPALHPIFDKRPNTFTVLKSKPKQEYVPSGPSITLNAFLLILVFRLITTAAGSQCHRRSYEPKSPTCRCVWVAGPGTSLSDSAPLLCIHES